MRGVSLALGDFRMPVFSLSVARDEGELWGGFEWLMRWLGASCCVVINLAQERDIRH